RALARSQSNQTGQRVAAFETSSQQSAGSWSKAPLHSVQDIGLGLGRQCPAKIRRVSSKTSEWTLALIADRRGLDHALFSGYTNASDLALPFSPNPFPRGAPWRLSESSVSQSDLQVSRPQKSGSRRRGRCTI